jgi:hypothetical protein
MSDVFPERIEKDVDVVSTTHAHDRWASRRKGRGAQPILDAVRGARLVDQRPFAESRRSHDGQDRTPTATYRNGRFDFVIAMDRHIPNRLVVVTVKDHTRR